MSGGYSQGTVVNYSPPANQGPAPVGCHRHSMSVEVKPITGVDLQTSYVYSLYAAHNGRGCLRQSRADLALELPAHQSRSFNLIGQYISTLPHEDLTDLTNSKTLFGDALFTYMPHPGTALYVGYIGNFANIDRSLCTRDEDGGCNPLDPILPPTYSSLMNDGKTIYVKVSYLLRF